MYSNVLVKQNYIFHVGSNVFYILAPDAGVISRGLNEPGKKPYK